MSSALLRTAPALRAGLRARAAQPIAAMASTSFVRGKATLPDLSCKKPSQARPLRITNYSVSLSNSDGCACTLDDYGALEPFISGKIMELHHSKHHQTYVNSFNAATEALEAATSKGDVKAAAAQAPLLNFHGGGHVNHSLFWENLAPNGKGGGGQPEGKLMVCFD